MNISVALIFFNRPKELNSVFSQIKKVKPNKLFLIQDGPRNEKDLDKIMQSRKIVEDIDWECEVFRNYSNVNLGCGERPYTGISWAFEKTDSLIILEDDCFPSLSFFSYCSDLLKRYEFDSRIGIISGTNNFDYFDFGGSDYGFVKSGNISGWATWKSRWKKYDFNANLINDEYLRKCLYYDISSNKRFSKKRIDSWIKVNKDILTNNKVSCWDYQWGLARHLNSYLAIIPRVNLIENIGFNENATHEANLQLLPKKIRNMYNNKCHEMVIKNHPRCVIPNRMYDMKLYEAIYPNYFTALLNKVIKLIKIIYINLNKANEK